MSYGSAAGVAGASSMWADRSVRAFTAATTPSLSQVNTWLDEVSATVDSALADEGFTVPVTIAAIVLQLDLLVNGIVADLVDWSHKAGRFYSTQALKTGVSPFMTIDKELHEWIQRKSVGFENQGLPKSETGRQVASFDVL